MNETFKLLLRKHLAAKLRKRLLIIVRRLYPNISGCNKALCVLGGNPKYASLLFSKQHQSHLDIYTEGPITGYRKMRNNSFEIIYI